MGFRRMMAACAVAAGAMSAWAVPAVADTQIDNPPVRYTGGLDTFGETVTVPEGDTYLTTFSLFAAIGAGKVRAEIYAWDGTKASGPPLYESPLVDYDTGDGSFQELPFDTGGINLTAGGRYVLFLTQAAGKGGAGLHQAALSAGDDYAGGQFTGREAGDDPAGWTTTDWYGAPPDWDAALKATFTTPPSSPGPPGAQTGPSDVVTTGPAGIAASTASGRDTTAPIITAPSLSSSVFAVNTKARASAASGTRLYLTLSESATVVFVTEQRVSRRWRNVRTFGRRLSGGTNRLDYSGKIRPRGRQRALKPGRYRLRMRASDRAGNRGRVTTVGFTIVK